MIRIYCITLFLIVVFPISDAYGTKSMLKPKKFSNPAAKFVGYWRVDSYDFREFQIAPEDIEVQIATAKNYTALPIGQVIEFQSLGAEVMPGTIDPTTMKSNGPTGEVLAIILHAPFEKKLCGRYYWKTACETQDKPFRREVMITDIVNWWKDATPEEKRIWGDLEPFAYTLNDLGRQFYLDAWIAKNGDIVFELLLKGNGLNGRTGGVVGVRLKRIK